MTQCINHPDKEATLRCMKHGIDMCDACAHCRDPKIHCKFRPSCPIWFLEKRGGRTIDASPEEEPAVEEKACAAS